MVLTGSESQVNTTWDEQQHMACHTVSLFDQQLRQIRKAVSENLTKH